MALSVNPKKNPSSKVNGKRDKDDSVNVWPYEIG